MPVVGQDESFPGKFTIHAEKCPNRKGVEEVLSHFCGGQIKSFEEVLEDVSAGRFKAAWVSGGYQDAHWCVDNTAAQFATLDLLIVQEMFASPLWHAAHYQLPGAGFASALVRM